MKTLDELIAGDEAERLAQVRREMAEERAAWNALTPAEQATEIAKMEAKWATFGDALEAEPEVSCEDCGEIECECEDDPCD